MASRPRWLGDLGTTPMWPATGARWWCSAKAQSPRELLAARTTCRLHCGVRGADAASGLVIRKMVSRRQSAPSSRRSFHLALAPCGSPPPSRQLAQLPTTHPDLWYGAYTSPQHTTHGGPMTRIDTFRQDAWIAQDRRLPNSRRWARSEARTGTTAPGAVP